MRKRCLALVIALMVLSGTAHAALLPEWDALLARYEKGDALRLNLEMDIAEWTSVSAQTLPALKGVLRDTAVTVYLSKHATEASLSMKGSALAGIRLDSLADGREAMTLKPGGLAYIADAGLMVSHFLMNQSASAGPMNAAEWLSILNGVRQTLPDILAPLDDYGTASKQGISIKNAGTARSRIEYNLTAEEWNALWPLVLYQLEHSVPFAQSVGTTLHRRVLSFLGTITFESKCTLKRFLDADGVDMGWQFTGQVGRAGSDVRKVTLYGGINDASGLYLSLKLPALSGQENLALLASMTWKERSAATAITGDFNLRTVTGPSSVTENIKVDLKHTKEDLRLSGKVVWNTALGGPQKAKSTLTIKPDLQSRGDTVSGTLDVSSAANGSSVFSGLIRCSLAPDTMPEGTAALRTVDLTKLNEQQLMQERSTLAALVTMPLWAYLEKLPQEQRRSILHDLGRSQQSQGETVPVMDLPGLRLPETTPSGSYIVDTED